MRFGSSHVPFLYIRDVHNLPRFGLVTTFVRLDCSLQSVAGYRYSKLPYSCEL